MIILDYPQGSPEWHAARLGVVTASRFSDIVTPTGKASASAERYMHQLLAEWALGEEVEEFSSYWMERGQRFESEARGYYEFVREVSVQQVGFVYLDDAQLVGCSPDWLIGDDGGGEVKCPKATTHMGYLASDGLPKDHKAQVQGCMWVTGREWWDFVSYYPGLPVALRRIERDDDFHAALDEHIPAFVERMVAARVKLQEQINEAA